MRPCVVYLYKSNGIKGSCRKTVLLFYQDADDVWEYCVPVHVS